MSSKYIDNNTYATFGYTLSGVFQSITIGASGSIGGSGLVGDGGKSYTIANHGRVTGTANGISLKSSGSTSITNTGADALIEGGTGIYAYSYRATLANSGNIKGTGTSGVGIELVLSGYPPYSTGSSEGLITNSGTVSGNYGIIIGTERFRHANGTIVNTAGGLIYGVKSAVGGGGLSALDLVINAGVIRSGFDGVSSGTVVNSGTIMTTGTYKNYYAFAVECGVLDNSGFIGGPTAAVVGMLNNSGTIESSGKNAVGVSATANVYSTVKNSGLIEGYTGVTASGLVLNSGTIMSRAKSGSLAVGAYLNLNSGINPDLDNTRSGLIEGYRGVVIGNGNASTLVTIVNSGTIASTRGAAGTAILIDSGNDTLIEEAGSTIIGQVVSDAGGTLELAGGNGSFTGLGSTERGFGLVEELADASFKFTGSNRVAVGTELLLDGTSALGGTLYGGGTLVVGAGITTLESGAKLEVADTTLSNATLQVNTDLIYRGTLSISSGVLGLGKGVVMGLSQATTFTHDRLTGQGVLATYGDIALLGLTVAGGAVLEDFDTMTLTGTLKLGQNASSAGKLLVQSGAAFEIESGGISDASSASEIVNDGLFEKFDGGGLSTIGPRVINDGTIEVETGTLELLRLLTGIGSAEIAVDGTLELDGAVASTQTIAFDSTVGGRVVLDDPQGHGLGFKGIIAGFRGSDELDLRSFALSGKPTLAWTQGGSSGTLTIKDGADTAKITLFGQYVAGGFALSGDGHLGTLISYHAPAQQQAKLTIPTH